MAEQLQVRYLTVEQVIFLHARLIAETGGSHGVRDLGMLQSAISRPQASFEGNKLYPDIYTKAAAQLESLANNHAFIDGNKRTAITATGLFLLYNGHRLTALNEDVVTFMMAVAQGTLPFEAITDWLRQHSKQVG